MAIGARRSPRRKLGAVLVGLCLVLVAGAGCGGGERTIVASGTTLVDSGFLDALLDRAPVEGRFAVVADATARVLELGRRGGAALLITHEPEAEAAFIAEVPTARYELVFTSRFVLVGPPELVAELTTLNLDESLRVIARRGWTFVSRADGSGTHVKERSLWGAAGVDPTGMPWYRETGLGMGFTLQVADQRGGFTLAEEGAYLAAMDRLALVPVPVDDPRLENPYHATVVADAPGAEEAVAVVDWLVSDEGRDAIVSVGTRLYGYPVYRPPGR